MSAPQDGQPGSRATGSYTPDSKDVGNYLRALVKYTDADGDGKSMEKVSDNRVRMEDYANMPPRFMNSKGEIPDSLTREIFEDPQSGSAVGDPIVATDTNEIGDQEVLEYSISGTDRSSFTINRLTGQVSIAAGEELDFEVPSDVSDTDISTNATSTAQADVSAAAGDNMYHVLVSAEDPSGASIDVVVIITVKDRQETPELADAEPNAEPVVGLSTISVAEKTMANVTLSTYVATDDEDRLSDVGSPQSLTDLKWSLSGTDMGAFEIGDSANPDQGFGSADIVGRFGTSDDKSISTIGLRFKEEPDFENPTDSNRDNTYNVTITATDSYGSSSSRDATVTVTNIEEPGTVELTNRQPEVGIQIRAELTDPDGGIRGVTWQWSNAAEDTDIDAANWVDIAGATAATYTPGTGDFEKDLRVVATYRNTATADNLFTHDKDESIRTATTTSVFAVKDSDANNQAPVFPDQDDQTTGDQSDRATRSVLESARHPDAVGDPVSASPDRDGADNGAGDNLTYTLGGTDANLFSIEQDDLAASPPTMGGQILVRGGTEFDFETKTSYTVTVTATDPSLASDTITVTINILDVDEPPDLSKRGLAVSGSRSVSYAENDTADVATYAATGSDAAGSTWSVEGADAGAFAISSGILAFRSSPNYESPTDQNTDNAYEVTVKATSGTISMSRNVNITVTNEDEDGEVRFTSTSLVVRVGVELEAELDEADDETNVTWQWASGGSATGPWSPIGGATNATYTPLANDVGDYLQVTASYTDASFGSDSESAVTPDPVAAEATAGTDGTVRLSPTGGLVSGDPVTAQLTDPDNPTSQVWLWQRSANGSANWTTISGVTSASYTTINDDGGHYLRASVTYDDESGSGQTAGPTATTDRVRLHTYDGNADGAIQRSEVIQAINDFLFPPDPNNPISRDEVIKVINLYLFG